MRTVLFLCTGNYYRSRFAALLFDHLNPDPEITVDSAGLGPSDSNVGKISPLTVEALGARSVEIPELGAPRRVEAVDLERAAMVIAVDEHEHRPMLETRFPTHVEAVRFWNVHDLHLTPAADALEALAIHVGELVDELCGIRPNADPEILGTP